MNEDEKILVEFIVCLETLIKTYRELELNEEWRTTNDRN